MENTKKCPYCGEEILAEAKKCKHCGEWLEEHEEQSLLTDEEIDKIAEDAVNEVFAEEEKKEKKLKNWLRYLESALCIAGFLVLLYFTVPKESKHLAKANEYADKCSELYLRDLKEIAAENKNPLYSVSDFISEDDCIVAKKEIRRLVNDSFDYTNCLLFSVGDIDGRTTQVGLLGFVMDFTPVDEKEIYNLAVDTWNSIVESGNNDSGLDLSDFLDFLSLFDENSNEEAASTNTKTITLQGGIFESSTQVTMTLSISDDDSVNGTVKFEYEGLEDALDDVYTSTVKGQIASTADPIMVTMSLVDDQGITYTFDPFAKDFDWDEFAVHYGSDEIIYLSKDE